MSAKQPWHGVEWSSRPQEHEITQQIEGDCAFRVARNVGQLTLEGRMDIDTDDVVERTVSSQDYRRELMQNVCHAATGNAAYAYIVERNRVKEARKRTQTSRTTAKSSKTVAFADDTSKTATATKQQILISSDPANSPLPQRIASSPLFVAGGVDSDAFDIAGLTDLPPAGGSPTQPLISPTDAAERAALSPAGGLPVQPSTTTFDQQAADLLKARLDKQLVEWGNRLAICLPAATGHATYMRVLDKLNMVREYKAKVNEGMTVQLEDGDYDIYTSVTRVKVTEFNDDVAALEALVS